MSETLDPMLVLALKAMTDDQRLELLSELRDRFCRECGFWYEQPLSVSHDIECQCWNDE